MAEVVRRHFYPTRVSIDFYSILLDTSALRTNFPLALSKAEGGVTMAHVLKFLAFSGLLLSFASPALALDGNVDAGKKVFAKCAICHGVGDAKKPVGPTLNGVIGRTAGTEPEFLAKKGAGYSKAMIEAGAAGLVWTDAEMLEWITNPKKKIPGTKMVFPGLPKEQDRADLLAYVKTFSPQ